MIANREILSSPTFLKGSLSNRVDAFSEGLYRLKDPTTRRQRERRLKSDFAFFQCFSRLSLHTYFVKYRGTLLNLNSKGPYPSSEREITFRRCLFTFSVKRESRHFHVVVGKKRQRNMQKSVLHVQSYCFVNQTIVIVVF